MRLRFPLIVLAVVAALIGGAILTSGSGDDPSPAPELPKDVLVPPRVDLASLRGKPAAVNFFASWCGPCNKEAPQFEKLSRSLGGRARLVGVDYNDNASGARDFIAKFGLSYPILVDPDGVVGDRYGLTGLPATAILDARGRLVELLSGPQDVTTIRAALDAAQS